MKEQVDLSISTYTRLGSHARPFETPAEVIDRFIDFFEKHSKEATSLQAQQPQSFSQIPLQQRVPEINFFPKDEAEFKKQLLVKRQAWLVLHKLDGSKQLKPWNIYLFKESSSLRGNLSSGPLRDWRKKGIYKADVAIDKDDIG